MPNVASGMAISDDCKLRFSELKSQKNHRFIVYKIDEQTNQVMVDKIGTPDQGYEDLAKSLPDSECRYAIFDFDFIDSDNCQKSKIVFIAWSPDASNVRDKMLYASTKDRFKKELDGIQVDLQATEPCEMSMEIVKERATTITTN